MRPCFSILFVAFSCLTFTSCFLPTSKDGGKAELIPVSINNDYSMGVPSYMTKATNLNEDASLQFQNLFKEAYVIVIDESKEEFVDAYVELGSYDTTRSVLDNYADIQVQSTSANMNVVSRKDIAKLKINDRHAATTEMDASVEGVKVPVTYFLTFIEGDEKLYMIMAWTLQSKKETHRNDFESMAKSFKTLKAKPLALR